MSAVEIPEAVNEICEYAFSEHAIQEGLRYQRFNRVVSSNGVLHGEKLSIRASVQGSERKPYLVEVQVRRRKRGGINVESICTCPVGVFCKHAVAAIADVCGKDADGRVAAPRLAPPSERVVEIAPKRLSSAMSNWVARMGDRGAPEKAPPPKTLFYVLNVMREGGLNVMIHHATPRKNGMPGKPRECRAPDISPDSPLPAEDLAILRQLAGMDEGYAASTYTLEASFGVAMLRAMLATGRCHFAEIVAGEPLTMGAPRAAELGWRCDVDGTQRAALTATPEATPLALNPWWYVDTKTLECGPLECAQDAGQIAQWLAAPAVPPEETADAAKAMGKLALPAPQAIPVIERRNVAPKPVLRMMHEKLALPVGRYVPAAKGKRAGYETHTHATLARLEMAYDGSRVHHFSRDGVAAFRAGRVERIVRNTEIETYFRNMAVRAGLTDATQFYGYQLPEQYHVDATLPGADAWITFVREQVPKLEAAGFAVEYDSDFPYRIAQVEDWYSETTAAEGGNDWFSIELGILVDGERVNLLPMIRDVLRMFEKLEAGAKKPETVDLRLPDGRTARVPTERILGIAQTLAELYDPAALTGDRIKVSRLRAAELIDIPGAGQWKGNEELRELAKRIHGYQGIARLEPPAGLAATLRPYQLEGLAWLQFLREYGFGGILADDMGLGKTVQVLAHLVMEKEQGRSNLPSLVVAPTSLMSNWRAETERFAPGLRVLVSHGGERQQHFERLAEYDLIVTSYSLLPRDEEVLTKQPFHLAILDEAQYVKNPLTKWADVVRSLSARHRLCMTGTPMENHLGELWSLMTFLSPGYLGNQRQFSAAYRTPIEKHNDVVRRRLLGQRLRPFILRRKKEEVALDLPPKTEIVRTVELDGAQRDLYETIRIAMHERVRAEVAARGMDRSAIIILDALLKLRQACCDPRLVKITRARQVKQSAKLETLMEMVPKMVEEGRRILLFSQFTSMLDLIEPEMSTRGIPFVRLSGDTVDRATPVARFQAGEVPLFLISLKAGGTGLNLTAADTVIHYDPWWNPAVEQQATDRAHRIGQEKPVFVYKLVTQGTVEEKIVAMQEKKRELVAGLLGEGAQQNLKLSREELEHLFDPLA